MTASAIAVPSLALASAPGRSGDPRCISALCCSIATQQLRERTRALAATDQASPQTLADRVVGDLGHASDEHLGVAVLGQEAGGGATDLGEAAAQREQGRARALVREHALQPRRSPGCEPTRSDHRADPRGSPRSRRWRSRPAARPLARGSARARVARERGARSTRGCVRRRLSRDQRSHRVADPGFPRRADRSTVSRTRSRSSGSLSFGSMAPSASTAAGASARSSSVISASGSSSGSRSSSARRSPSRPSAAFARRRS